MDKVNHYTDHVSGIYKGCVTIDKISCAAELTLGADGVSIRVFDFNKQLKHDFLETVSLNKMVFQSEFNYYILFGLYLMESSFMQVGRDDGFYDYVFTVQGFAFSRGRLDEHSLYRNISVQGEGIVKWSGYTRKLKSILESGLGGKVPSEEDVVEFERKIPNLGVIGLYYLYTYGGVKGLHTVGIDVKPTMVITFEAPVSLSRLIECYIDLYMFLRFLIGSPIIISNVETQTTYELGVSSTQLYLAEKKSNENISAGMLLPYSSIYRDDLEETFPHCIWDNFYNLNNKVRELVKKYVTYTMVNNNEERFLGFYRIIETMTKEDSYYVDKEELSNLLGLSRKFLARRFPNVSLGGFIREIKRCNGNKNNTESCIRHFINGFPNSIIEGFKLKEISVGEVCASRNKIIHQPLFSESPEKIHKHMNSTEVLIKLAMLRSLGVSDKKLEEIIFY